VVLNTDDGAPMGVGAVITLSGADFGDDHVLTRGETFDVTALIGIATTPRFWIEYEVWGVPSS
jgi:hypothetical protein